mgnify:CR=1 FL=1|jgi:hypothetical protein
MKPFPPWFICNVIWAGLLRFIQLYYVTTTTIPLAYISGGGEGTGLRPVNTLIWMIVVISLSLLLLTVVFEMLLTERVCVLDRLSSASICFFSALVTVFGFLVVVTL